MNFGRLYKGNIMGDMQVEFIGGDKDGQHLSPVSESELQDLGYRIHIKTIPKGNELPYCTAVPSNLTKEEAHQVFIKELNKRSRSGPGKRSI